MIQFVEFSSFFRLTLLLVEIWQIKFINWINIFSQCFEPKKFTKNIILLKKFKIKKKSINNVNYFLTNSNIGFLFLCMQSGLLAILNKFSANLL